MWQFCGQPCAKCGRVHESNLGHHIVFKSQSGYMVLVFLNLIPLCIVCHARAHNNKLEFFDWLDREYPDRLERLNEIKQECQRLRLSHQEIYEKWGKDEHNGI